MTTKLPPVLGANHTVYYHGTEMQEVCKGVLVAVIPAGAVFTADQLKAYVGSDYTNTPASVDRWVFAVGAGYRTVPYSERYSIVREP